ncbi:MAG TPA: PAS domain-containing protein [Terriglobales bacterium]
MADFLSILRIFPQNDSRQSLRWRYGGAILISVGFLAGRWLLGRYMIDDGFPFTLLTLPVALSAFYGGLGPGIVSVLICVMSADYFLVAPLYTLGLPGPKAVVGTLLFAFSGLVISALGEASREAVLQASNEAEIRKVTQRQLLANEERLGIAKRVVSGGVWDWDIVNDIVYWSDGFQRLYDFSLDEKPSRQKWEESMHPDDRDWVVAQLDELFRQRLHNWSEEYRIRTASGRVRWVASQGQVFYDPAGKPERMVGINLDITARRLAENTARDADLPMRLA